MVFKTDADRTNVYVTGIDQQLRENRQPAMRAAECAFIKILEKVYKKLMVPDTMNIILQYCMYCCL